MLFIVEMLQNYALLFLKISTAKWLIYEQNIVSLFILTA